MWRNTKHDLSFNHVTLDVEALKVTADIAAGRLLQRVAQLQREMIDYAMEKKCIRLSAQRLKEEADMLATVAETRSAIYGIDEREMVTLLRKSKNSAGG